MAQTHTMTHTRKAVRGAYGARPYDPSEAYAKALIEGIREELHGADFFQREDLLHLKCFSSVATITRYRYVCEGVGYLLNTGELVQKSRSDLCLPEKQKDYDSDHSLADRFESKVRRLVAAQKDSFTVMDCVRSWARSDQHLTENTKRIAVRGVLTRLTREGELEREGYFYTNLA